MEKIKAFLEVQKIIYGIANRIISGKYNKTLPLVSVSSITKAHRIQEFEVDVDFWHFGMCKTRLFIPFDAITDSTARKQYVKEQINRL